MSGAAANTTNDVSSEVSLLWAVVFAVTDTATVLADLVFVITESTIECRQLAKLVALVVILALRCRSSLKQRSASECVPKHTGRRDCYSQSQ